MGLRDQPDLLVQLVPTVRCRVQQVPQGQLVTLVPQAQQVRPVILVWTVQQGLPDLRVTPAPQGQLVRQGHKVMLDREDLQAQLDRRVMQARLVQQAQLEIRVRLVAQDPQVQPGLLARHQLLLAQLGLLALLVQQGLQVLSIQLVVRRIVFSMKTRSRSQQVIRSVPTTMLVRLAR